MLKRITDFLRSLYGTKKTQIVTELPSDMVTTINAQKELAQKRFDTKLKKADVMGSNAKDSLSQHIQLYLQNYTTDKAENERVFGIVDKSWKEYCYKVNSIQKLIIVDVLWFGREINRIVNSKEFNDKLTQKIKSNG